MPISYLSLRLIFVWPNFFFSYLKFYKCSDSYANLGYLNNFLICEFSPQQKAAYFGPFSAVAKLKPSHSNMSVGTSRAKSKQRKEKESTMQTGILGNNEELRRLWGGLLQEVVVQFN